VPQFLKEDLRQQIVHAAARVFAAKGHGGATMAEVAAAAGVSTGNLYRYFEAKDVLFDEVVPPALARRLSSLIRQKVEALGGVEDVGTLGAGAPWRVVSEELLAFAIVNRLPVVILLAKGKASGTAHEGFSERMVQELVKLALAYARTVRPAYRPTPAARFALERVYRGLVDTMTSILEAHEDERAIRAAAAEFSTYHLAGMKAFFERDSS
jgi:AcrR family transcriptional regulator